MLRRAIRRLAVTLIVGSTSASAALAASDPANPATGLRETDPAPRAFVHARLHVTPERVIDDATLLVRGGVVEAIGVGLEVPPGVTSVDVAGAAIYPGFIDPFTDYGLAARSTRGDDGDDDTPQYLGTGGAGASWNDAIHAETLAAFALRPNPEAAEEHLERGTTTVLSLYRDGIFRGRGAVVSLASGPPDEVVIEPAGPHGVSFDKGTSSQAYPSSLMGAIALVRQTLLDARRVGRAPAAARPAADRAVTTLAHDLFETPRPPAILVETEDEHSLLRAASLGAELGVPMVHVGSGFEYRRLSQIAALGSTIVLPARLPEKPDVATLDAALDVSLADLRHWERAATNPARLVAAGVPIAFTSTGSGKNDDLLGFVRAAVRAGLAPKDALAALTSTPARLLGVADRVGSLEVGRRADFVIADDQLFRDEKAEIRSVWIGGALAKELTPAVLDLRGRWGLSVAGLELELTVEGARPAKLEGTARPLRPVGDEPAATEPETAPGETVSSTGEQPNDERPSTKLVDLAVGERTATFRLDLVPLGGTGVARVAIRHGRTGLEARIGRPDGTAELTELEHLGPAEPAEVDELEPLPALVSRETLPPTSAFGFEQLPEPTTVLVRGATIWTSAAAGVIEGGDLLVEDGRIAALGRGLTAPSGARVIDGTGLHVTAGIIDEHSHLALAAVNEGTHPVTSEVRMADVIDPDDVGIWRALAGGTTTMQLLHGSANPIGGQAAIVKLRWGSPAREMLFEGAPPSIKFALGENVKQSNWDDPGPRYPKTRMGVEARMRDAFLAARDYREEWRRWDGLSAAEQGRRVPPRRDLQLEPLVEILDGKRSIHCHSYVQSEILALMRLAEELDFRVGTFTHVLEGYKVAPELAAHGAGASGFADWWAYKLEVFDAIPHNACLLHRAGVVTSINSDSGELIRRLNQEASKSVLACDMPEPDALDLVTINPARQLGIDDQVGSLEVGKDADFVIWNGHPLSTLSRVEQTWVDGVPLFTRELDAELRAAAARERSALIQKALDAKEPGGSGPAADEVAAHPDWTCDGVGSVATQGAH